MRSVVQRESSSSCYTKTSSIASVRSRSFGSFRVLRRCARTPLTNVVLESTPPNKRLKLAGAQQVGRNCVASPASLFFCRSTALRPRALRPQLKRDPLGGRAGSDPHRRRGHRGPVLKKEDTCSRQPSIWLMERGAGLEPRQPAIGQGA